MRCRRAAVTIVCRSSIIAGCVYGIGVGAWTRGMFEDFCGREGDIIFLEDVLEICDSGFEVEDVALFQINPLAMLIPSRRLGVGTDLLGISLLVIGS